MRAQFIGTEVYPNKWIAIALQTVPKMLLTILTFPLFFILFYFVWKVCTGGV